MTAPAIRWTPAEGLLIAEVARRSLVATLDGGEVVAGSEAEGAPFQVAFESKPDAITLELRLAADHATIVLAPSSPSGHRWRDGWMLEVSRGDERWMLSARTPAITIADARREPLHVHLRLQHRAIERSLAGVVERVPVIDFAYHRYTRQSTLREVDPAPLAPWAAPTELESKPWWELDLGHAMYVAWLRIDLAAPPPGTRVVIRAYGFVMPSGAPPPRSVIYEAPAEELGVVDGRAWIVLGAGVVARYVQVELVAAGGPVSLAVTSTEVLAAELYANGLEATLRRSFALHHDRPLVVARAPDGEGYLPSLTYGEVWSRAMALSRGLAARLEPDAARIVIVVMLRNRAEWVMADLAALVRGYVTVPIAPDDADDRVAQILERAHARCVICEPDNAERVARLAGGTPLVVVCDARLGDDRHSSFAAIVLDGATATVPDPEPRRSDDLYAVLFTSGSTGTPRGAMRTYATFFEMVKSYLVGHSPRHLSFQPLSHLSERMYLPSLLAHGGTIAFSRGGAHLLDELRVLEPTTIGTVPRLFEVLHAGFVRRMRAAIVANPDTPRGVLEARALAETRAAFGGRLFAVSVGSAPVSAEVLAFMRRCFADIWVSEGYGSTEVGTITSDGKISEHVMVKLVPLRDAPVALPGAPERGEIYVLSPHAIVGYLGDPEATAAAFDGDGYFATGDLGERDATGCVRVVGRIRNTVKLAQGEFVSAERIEAALGTAPIVDRIYVHAEHGAIGVAALVVPHADVLARALGATGSTLAALAAHPSAAAAVLAALRVQARNLAGYETPRGVLLEPAPLTVESGLLTASGKLARGTLASRYGARLAALAAGEVVAAHGEPVPDDDLVDLSRRVTRAASRVLGRAVDPQEPLGTGVGVDSLAAAEILAALSDELGREVPLAWWFEARTFDELATRLARFADLESSTSHASKCAAKANAELAVADREPLALIPRGDLLPDKIARVLLTGATGFLGAHLVESLRARGVEVVCLVRAADDGAATARLAAALRSREIVTPLDHVRAIAADLAAPELAERVGELAVDAIIHAGATVSWLASYPALRGPNVSGTRALLELAAARGLPFHHVSTISTAPRDGDEDSGLSFEAAVATTPYALSKWIAEEHVRRAAAVGLPAAIYRPAMIAGHSQRGVGNPEDFLTRYLAGCGELGLYIDRDDAVLDMTPVDFVADSIAMLAVTRPRGDGITYHLANVDQSLGFGALGRALAAAGLAVEPATYAQFRAALVQHRTCRLHALAAFFPEAFSLGMGPWPCARTVSALAELGIQRPRIDDAVIARYVAAIERHGLPRPAC